MIRNRFSPRTVGPAPAPLPPRFPIEGADGLSFSWGPQGAILRDTRPRLILARITGNAPGTNRYAFEQIDEGDEPAFNAALADQFGAEGTEEVTGGCAFEINGNIGVPTDGSVKVWLWPSAAQSFWLFSFQNAIADVAVPEELDEYGVPAMDQNHNLRSTPFYISEYPVNGSPASQIYQFIPGLVTTGQPVIFQQAAQNGNGSGNPTLQYGMWDNLVNQQGFTLTATLHAATGILTSLAQTVNLRDESGTVRTASDNWTVNTAGQVLRRFTNLSLVMGGTVTGTDGFSLSSTPTGTTTFRIGDFTITETPAGTTTANFTNVTTTGLDTGGRTEGTLDAAGSTQADATPITATVSHITNANGVMGVILPNAEGELRTVWNDSGLNDLLVYPPVGAQINGGGLNNPYTQVGGTVTRFERMNSTTWFTWG